MKTGNGGALTGYAAIVGGALGLLLAPVMVIVKYMTGWEVVPEPSWVGTARAALAPLLHFASPAGLWMVYGTAYTFALLLMLAGVIGWSALLRDRQGRLQTKGYWVLLFGLGLVIPGDAIHTWTWHQNGLMTPTPGSNPIANTAYAVHMMGMNLVMVGSIIVSVSALRRKFLARCLAWCFLLIFPSAIAASLTVLPTTPSGALWLFSGLVMVCGYLLATGQRHRLVAT